MTVNDGKGLYDNEGLCDTLIVDCNNIPKQLMTGNYVQFCNTLVQMVQKIANLKKGIQAETESLKQNIEELKKANKELLEQINKKDGAE